MTDTGSWNAFTPQRDNTGETPRVSAWLDAPHPDAAQPGAPRSGAAQPGSPRSDAPRSDAPRSGAPQVRGQQPRALQSGGPQSGGSRPGGPQAGALPPGALPSRQETRGDRSDWAAEAGNWEVGNGEAGNGEADSWEAGDWEDRRRREPTPEPKYGPAPPATNGRTSFGFTAGPISGNWRDDAPISPAMPSRRQKSAPPAGRQEQAAPPGRRDQAPPIGRQEVGPPAGRQELALPARRQEAPLPARRQDVERLALPTRPYGSDEGAASGWDDAPPPATGAHSVRRQTGAHAIVSRAEPEWRRPEDDHIGDLVGDAAHEIRPHRAVAGAGTAPARPRRSPAVMVAGLVLTAAVAVGGTVAGITYFSGASGDPTSVLGLDAGRAENRTATALLEGRKNAEFELVSAVTKVTVRSEDLGDSLYRMTTAEASGLLPKPELTQDRVELHLAPGAGGGDVATGEGEVEVVLSSKVMWTLRFSGASEEQQLNMQDGQVGGIDFSGGSKRTAIQLPKASGTVLLTVAGAMDELAMTSPTGNPVRVKVRGGADTVAAGKRTLRDVAPGSTLTPKGWATENRYDVDAESPVTLLSVETRD
ncbi:hypothetical protein [Actinoplanes sp. NPDC051494]|uniref:hypothetical protein n=1 Tax=Actinoplanes sp. NPDC051494 TaxID=3363907 RepID=UPI00378C4F16